MAEKKNLTDEVLAALALTQPQSPPTATAAADAVPYAIRVGTSQHTGTAPARTVAGLLRALADQLDPAKPTPRSTDHG